MKKEAKKIFSEEIKNFIERYYELDTYKPLDENGDLRTIQTFNSFSERVFYDDYSDGTIQDQFCQFLQDNFYSYYYEMIQVLVRAGYPEKQPNGQEWPNNKIINLFGFGMFTAFKDLLKKMGCDSYLYNLNTRRNAAAATKILYEGMEA